MPKISYNKDGTGSITWDQDDWLAGLIDSSASDYSKITGFPTAESFDPLTSYGYAAPGVLGTAVTNNGTLTGVSRSSVVKGDSAYLVSDGSQVAKLDTLATGSVDIVSPFPHTIGPGTWTSVSGNDIGNYYKTTALTGFYSFNYNDGTAKWNVGSLTYPSTFDDDFMSTVPTSPLSGGDLTGGYNYPHPLILGDNDKLYIGDRNYVHSYDGQLNVFSARALSLPQGWIITCFAKTQDLRLAIGAYYDIGQSGSTFNRGQSKMWVWTYDELDVDYGIDLKDNYVSEIIPWQNTIAAFTSGPITLGSLGPYKLQKLNGTQFEVVKTWVNGGIPVRGGVDNVGNDLYWNGGGYLYSYTKLKDDLYGRYILNSIGRGTSGGFFKFFTARQVFHTASSGIMYFSPANGYAAGATLEAEGISPEFPLLQKGKISGISFKFQRTFSGGRSLRLNLITDESPSGAVVVDNFTASTKLRKNQIQNKTDGTPLGTFSFIQPQLIWQNGSAATPAPLVDWLRIDFELTNI